MSNELEIASRRLILTVDKSEEYSLESVTVCQMVGDGNQCRGVLLSSEPMTADKIGTDIKISYTQTTGDIIVYLSCLYSYNLLDYDIVTGVYRFEWVANPWFELLRDSSNCRIFQSVTTQSIISTIFSELNYSGCFEFKLIGDDEVREYCVQFNESNYDFICRIMSEVGWHYHFSDESDVSKLIISDNNEGFSSCDPAIAEYLIGSSNKFDCIKTWSPHYQASIGTARSSDYSMALVSLLDSGEQYSASDCAQVPQSYYIYPSRSTTTAQSSKKAKLAIQSFDSQSIKYIGTSNLVSLMGGKQFTLSGHEDSALNQTYIILECYHNISAEGVGEVHYNNRISALPIDIEYKNFPFPASQIHSLQSAVVVGPSGNEIYRDTQNRIKVQFHWDLEGKLDENSSAWIRVSQAMIGQGFGMMFTPRIGDEVLVGFIDGNPDNPIVLGALYDDKSAPPFESSTQFGLMTRSTPSGSASNAHVFRFDDKKDNEEIYLQSEKDFNVLVKNNRAAQIQGDETHQVDKSYTQTVTGAAIISTEDAYSIKATKTMKLDATEDLSFISAASISGSASENVSFTASSDMDHSGTNITLDGSSSIKLTCGSSEISMSSSSISISSPSISIEATGTAELKGASVTVEGQATATVKGVTAELNGSATSKVTSSGIAQISGSLTTIN
ncbi:type VI secretion system tip protein TssI/VgrG [uncultured Shewanella sp.]|uniref:type VI secretion system Vgr family protein n=1 Tax=uncultured Shewanella sp. TaxID=173975 RepID=UPI0026224371|nr:type VI secretion system tip protein TssI/VgrG [uncultured Shewanella sp.]